MLLNLNGGVLKAAIEVLLGSSYGLRVELVGWRLRLRRVWRIWRRGVLVLLLLGRWVLPNV